MTVLTIDELLGRFAELFEERQEQLLNQTQLLDQLGELVNVNLQLSFSQQLKQYKLDCSDERLLFYTMIHMFINEDDNQFGWHDCRDVYDKKKRVAAYKKKSIIEVQAFKVKNFFSSIIRVGLKIRSIFN